MGKSILEKMQEEPADYRTSAVKKRRGKYVEPVVDTISRAFENAKLGTLSHGSDPLIPSGKPFVVDPEEGMY